MTDILRSQCRWGEIWSTGISKNALTRIGARSLQEFSKEPDFDNCPPTHSVLSNEHAHHTIGIRFQKSGWSQILCHPLIFSCATRYNKPCSDACESRGESYYWCNTGSTWDYCSPAGNILLPIIFVTLSSLKSLCPTMPFQLRQRSRL